MLQTKIGELSLASCFMNASGARCAVASDLHALDQSAVGALVSKSCTLDARLGNPSPRYVETSWGSINSMGLPNEGWAYYAALAQDLQKPYFISVAGLTLEENVAIVQQLAQTIPQGQLAGIELNLSCPNVPGKPQTGYDFERSQAVLEAVFAVNKHPLGVKLPPYFDLVHFEQMAAVLVQFPITFVTCVNSIGNGLVLDWQTETVVIKPKQGFGGIGGDYIKPTALANVRQFRLLLPPNISVIGCGGVKTGSDAFEHLLCGADAIQIGTQLMKEGFGCFERIAQELTDILKAKGYENIAQCKGKLKVL